jgi:hypothetical protein
MTHAGQGMAAETPDGPRPRYDATCRNGDRAMTVNRTEQLATPTALIDRLKQNPQVLGILRYGAGIWPDGADTDLCVVVAQRPTGLESVHFWLTCGPVDLNVRTVKDLERCDVEPGFDEVLLKGEVLYEREPGLLGALSDERPAESSPPDPGQVTRMRFGHAHYLQKLEHHGRRDPLLCSVLVCGAVHWLVRAYVSVRGLPYRGERAVLRMMADDDASLLADMELATGAGALTDRIEAVRRLTAKVLGPVGGSWRQDEVLYFEQSGTEARAREEWDAFFTSLLGFGHNTLSRRPEQ